jgi:hypothetical protein
MGKRSHAEADAAAPAAIATAIDLSGMRATLPPPLPWGAAVILPRVGSGQRTAIG